MTRLPLLLSLLLMLALISVPSATAEHEWDHRYTINGHVTEPSGSPARWAKVTIDCSIGATHEDLCGDNSARGAKTGTGGDFSIGLHIHSSDDGKTVVLIIDGQSFNHTLDLKGPDGQPEEADRTVDLDFMLDHKVSHTDSLVLIALFLVTIVAPVVGFFVIRRRKANQTIPEATPGPKQAAAESEVVMVNCPKCDVSVKSQNLVKHLKKAHGWSNVKATLAAEELAEGDGD